MIAKPCFPWAHIGVPGYSLCLPWASPGTGEAPRGRCLWSGHSPLQEAKLGGSFPLSLLQGTLRGTGGVSVGQQRSCVSYNAP